MAATRWSRYKPATRARIAERYQREYGLNRRSVREMVNRGTIVSPLSRESLNRVPADVIRHPEKYPRMHAGEMDLDSLREAAMARYEAIFENDINYNRSTVTYGMGYASPAALYVISQASEDELREWGAIYQKAGDNPMARVGQLPRGLTEADVTFTDANGNVMSVFFYHAG